MPSTWAIVVVVAIGAIAIVTLFVVALRGRATQYPSVYTAYLAYFTKALLGHPPTPVRLNEEQLAAVVLAVVDARRAAPSSEVEVMAAVQRLRNGTHTG